MTKRIMTMFLLLALAVGVYAMTGKASGGRIEPTQTAQASRTATNTAAVTCEVYTGVDGGTVNLRTCGGVSCAVLN
ncbi:MAG: hypothetical protein Q8L68_07710, partial [Methylococcales bacterium]|nr:hypothetical protein [Methylococcales bacterium]